MQPHSSFKGLKPSTRTSRASKTVMKAWTKNFNTDNGQRYIKNKTHKSHR